MDTTQVQASIEAVNKLVTLVVSRSTEMVKAQVSTQARLQAIEAGLAPEQIVKGMEEGLGNHFDQIV